MFQSSTYMIYYISNETLVLEHIESLLINDIKLKLSEEAILNVEKCNSFFLSSSWFLGKRGNFRSRHSTFFSCKIFFSTKRTYDFSTFISIFFENKQNAQDETMLIKISLIRLQTSILKAFYSA